MNLRELLEQVTTVGVHGPQDVGIEGMAYDSRQVKPGWVFVAVQGHRTDGAGFITEAVSKGAVAVVSEHDLDLGTKVAHVQVPRARRALAEIASAYYGHLSRSMRVIGVTGTNGKTTTAFMLREILRAGGARPGLLGTVSYEIGERSLPSARTTPEAPDIHALFQQMREAGCDSAVMEVSSHALALDRVHGIDFQVGVFTNLTQDHLDYHLDMERYFAAKSRLFSGLDRVAGRTAVINTDDPWGRRLVEEGALRSGIVTYGFREDAMVRATEASVEADRTAFRLHTPWGEALVRLHLLGRFNIHNALAAIAAGGACGIGLSAMVNALDALKAIPGRLELVSTRKGRRVFVDYAHTDDALRNVLSTLREICKGRLVVVFGCGGDRDRGKRTKMGQVAAALADYGIITSDNPRSEDPGAIAGDILKGYGPDSRFEVVLDRRDAIARGIEETGRNDVLLVAGKGHEAYQEFRNSIVPFDDREVVREIAG